MATERHIWLSGPVYGIPPLLVPVAHSLLQAREDAARAVAGVQQDLLWKKPNNAAPAGFHLFHAAHALDRLMTYARGESLQEAQQRAIALERSPDLDVDPDFLIELLDLTIERALLQLRCTSESALLKGRMVGSARLPSNVLGLLYHASEHTTRHVGQLITTLKVVQQPASATL
ncbi:MAG TPA: DinB family protein [Candidatus Krumholzibacteria bacterium]|jgi:uncharacterized damage-inducible protein DinB|nr:DinB family protein [Candidatus Krumholzibacteria bacterium]